jgi:hypothetical protein
MLRTSSEDTHTPPSEIISNLLEDLEQVRDRNKGAGSALYELKFYSEDLAQSFPSYPNKEEEIREVYNHIEGLYDLLNQNLDKTYSEIIALSPRRVEKHLSELARISLLFEEPVEVTAPIRIPYQKFRYLGFNVESFNLTDMEVKEMLDAIDFLVSLFKEREMTEVIYEAINSIELRDEVVSDGEFVSGYFHPTKNVLAIGYSKLKSPKRGIGYFSSTQEVLVHEIGHWVHLNYISREAREFWDSGWKHLLELEDYHISQDEKDNYFQVLSEAKGNLEIVKRRTTEIEYLKLLAFLEGKGFIRGEKGELSAKGEIMLGYFRDPISYGLKTLTGLELSYFKYDVKEGLLMSAMERIEKEARRTFLGYGETKYYPKSGKEIYEMKEALGIPTEYGKINEMEDFAETFVYFMMNPEALHPVARWRMGRTLGLSSATGKRVIRLARSYLAQKKHS